MEAPTSTTMSRARHRPAAACGRLRRRPAAALRRPPAAAPCDGPLRPPYGGALRPPCGGTLRRPPRGRPAAALRRRKALTDAVVVGSGVMMGNPALLSLHLMSLLAGLKALGDGAATEAAPFVLEVN